MSSSSHRYPSHHRGGGGGGGDPYAAWAAAPPSHGGGGGGYYYPVQAPPAPQPSGLVAATKTWFVRVVVLLVLAGVGVLYWRQSAMRASMRNFEAVVGALGQAVGEGAAPGGPRVHYALTTHSGRDDEGDEASVLEQAVGRVAGAMQSGRNRKSGRAVPGKSAHAKRSGVPPPPREVPEALVGLRQQQQQQQQQPQQVEDEQAAAEADMVPPRYNQPTEAEGIEVFDMRGKSKGWRLFSDAK